MRVFALLLLLFVPSLAFAQDASSQADIGGAITHLIEGLQSQNWMLVTCAGILVAVWVWNAFVMPKLISGDKHPKWKKASPWISIALGSVVQVVSALIAGSDVASAINIGVSTGLMAAGGWSAGGKYLLKPAERKLNAPSIKNEQLQDQKQPPPSPSETDRQQPSPKS